MLFRVILIFCFSISSTFANESEMNGVQWLKNMSQAMKALNYQGTVAFFKNGRLDTMKYFHVSENEREQERLLSLNSPMREVIREAGTVRCVFKKTKKNVLNHRPINDSFIIDLPDDFSNITSAYQLMIKDEESVAMLPAYVLSIEPIDEYRYRRKIWIDKASFLPLKTEVYDLSGVTVEQVVFTDIEVGLKLAFVNIDNESKDVDVKHVHRSKLAPINEASFILQNLPLNFHLVFFTQMNRENSTSAVEHALLSDGFSSVSVYKEAKASDTQEGLQTLGSVKSFTQVVDGFQITVMGEVPARTVQFIAQGVKLK
ncbi:MAG: outer membrane lipoprotein-sorting protein [Methylococcaceae bacterium]|nr:outer membrane lipoprotein-sorting protein [Methylococcaceae bacterium]